MRTGGAGDAKHFSYDEAMRIEDVIATLNEMEEIGVFERYAIGGAVGATIYLEPFATVDVDVFITFRSDEGGLIGLGPVYDFLKERGSTLEGEYVMIAGWPVQFLPPTGPLVEEALSQAVDVRMGEGEETARVFTAEHLAAVALETGRAKDKARLLQFLESGVMDMERFEGILLRHGLENEWMTFQRQFLRDDR